jgi:hypothetical protein
MRGPKPGPLIHGTFNAYTKRGCRCEKCAKFWHDYQAQQREKRKREGLSQPPRKPAAMCSPRSTEMVYLTSLAAQRILREAEKLEKDGAARLAELNRKIAAGITRPERRITHADDQY